MNIEQATVDKGLNVSTEIDGLTDGQMVGPLQVAVPVEVLQIVAPMSKPRCCRAKAKDEDRTDDQASTPPGTPSDVGSGWESGPRTTGKVGSTRKRAPIMRPASHHDVIAFLVVGWGYESGPSRDEGTSVEPSLYGNSDQVRMASGIVDKWVGHRRQTWIMAALYFFTGTAFAIWSPDKAAGWCWFTMSGVFVAIAIAVERRARRSTRR